jgi:hypothetical protein
MYYSHTPTGWAKGEEEIASLLDDGYQIVSVITNEYSVVVTLVKE